MRKVSTKKLVPGLNLAMPVYDNNGFIWLNRGVELTIDYIRTLERLKIPAVYIEDPLIPDVEVGDVVQDETRQQANRMVKNVMENIHNVPEKALPGVLAAKTKELDNLLIDITDQLLSNPKLVVNLTDIRTTDNYTFYHSVNVAILSIITARSMGFKTYQLRKVGMGALLHDLGKTKIPLSILNKKGRLLPEEFDKIKNHPQYGYNMVSMKQVIEPCAAKIIYQHHERINGEGYPNGLASNQTHLYSKICSVVDVYDALTADRPYREGFPPHKALEILESSGHEFDQNALQHLFLHVAAYPVGTRVGLSNGDAGVVVRNRPGYTRHPKVRVLYEKENFEPLSPYEIDLSEQINVVVDEIFSFDAFPIACNRKTV